jgi:transposase
MVTKTPRQRHDVPIIRPLCKASTRSSRSRIPPLRPNWSPQTKIKSLNECARCKRRSGLIELLPVWWTPRRFSLVRRSGIQRRKFNRESKLEAVNLIKDRGVSVGQASRDLGVVESVLRRWLQEEEEEEAGPRQAFLENGQVEPEQQELIQPRREVAKLKAERDILKKATAYPAKEWI